GVPPSLNVWMRTHWLGQMKLKRVWSAMCYLFSFEQRRQLMRWATEKRRMRVTITLHHSRFYDRDNAFGGASKIILDELRRGGLLYQDTLESVNCEVLQAKCTHKDRHTTIAMSLEE